ncbi:MAG: hypothetical protein CL946_01965 [Ectothiorhodospiraceae bacterium]|nr:hypothetical protein [Ectothiorhodospiraceae bacterium]
MPPTGSALRIARLTVLLAAVFLSGCGVTSFYVPVQRPMEINLTRMQRIGVAVAIVNRDSVNVQFSEEALTGLYTDLFRKDGRHTWVPVLPYDANPLFEILSQDSLRKGDLSALREKYELDGLIAGEVDLMRYTEEVVAAEVKQSDNPDAKKYVRMGLMEMSIFLRVYDMADEAFIWSGGAYHNVRDEKRSLLPVPPSLNVDGMLRETAAYLVDEFLELTRVITERRIVTFLTDGEFPEIKHGIEKAKAGEWNEAAALFKKLAEENPLAEEADKLWYNLGVAYQFGGDFRSAIESYERAQAIENSKRYEYAIEDCLKMEQEYLQLIELNRE